MTLIGNKEAANKSIFMYLLKRLSYMLQEKITFWQMSTFTMFYQFPIFAFNILCVLWPTRSYVYKNWNACNFQFLIPGILHARTVLKTGRLLKLLHTQFETVTNNMRTQIRHCRKKNHTLNSVADQHRSFLARDSNAAI